MRLPVKDGGERPNGRAGVCFYCDGNAWEHKDGCVCLTRSVVIRMTVEYVVEVPQKWDVDSIEFQRNDGSWCANNDFDDLAEIFSSGDCACRAADFRFVREATEADHRELPDLTSKTP